MGKRKKRSADIRRIAAAAMLLSLAAAAMLLSLAAAAMLLSLAAAASGSGALASGSEAWPPPTWYTVVSRPHDTLARLAERYHVTVDAVVRLNGLAAGSALGAGEVLRIPAGSSATRKAVLGEALDRRLRNYAAPPISFEASRYVQQREMIAPVVASDGPGRTPLRFLWPVRGSVISSFGPAGDGERNDGINITANLGAPIHAAASGTVTYVGDALKGYGNLILILHPGGYVTAYAHAQSITVERGDLVEKGQVIGTAGATGGVDRPQLHFEIRKGVKPLNPLTLLAANG